MKRNTITVRLLSEALAKQKNQDAIFVVPAFDHSYLGVSIINPITIIQHPDGSMSEDPGYDDDGMDECFGKGQWRKVNGLLIEG